MWNKLTETAAPCQPFVVRTGRYVEVCLDASLSEVLYQCLSTEILFAAATQVEIVYLLVEFVGTGENAVIGGLDIQSEDGATKGSHPCELIHVVQYKIKGLVSSP